MGVGGLDVDVGVGGLDVAVAVGGMDVAVGVAVAGFCVAVAVGVSRTVAVAVDSTRVAVGSGVAGLAVAVGWNGVGVAVWPATTASAAAVGCAIMPLPALGGASSLPWPLSIRIAAAMAATSSKATPPIKPTLGERRGVAGGGGCRPMSWVASAGGGVRTAGGGRFSAVAPGRGVATVAATVAALRPAGILLVIATAKSSARSPAR